MKLIISLLVFSLILLIYTRYLEKTSLFYPSRNISSFPDQAGLPYEDIFVTTKDGIKLQAWFIPQPKAKSTLIFFHGNAGNIGDRLEKIALFNQLGVNVLIISYRGYGNSEGSPSENGIYLDAQAAYDYLLSRTDINMDNIIVYGASLGGAPAIDLAFHRNVKALILDSTFTSAVDMAKVIYPFIPRIFLSVKLDNASKMQKISCPKLIIHSEDDEIVPYSLGRKLFEISAEPKIFLDIEGGHNDGHIVDAEVFTDGIRKFLTGLELI